MHRGDLTGTGERRDEVATDHAQAVEGAFIAHVADPELVDEDAARGEALAGPEAEGLAGRGRAGLLLAAQTVGGSLGSGDGSGRGGGRRRGDRSRRSEGKGGTGRHGTSDRDNWAEDHLYS